MGDSLMKCPVCGEMINTEDETGMKVHMMQDADHKAHLEKAVMAKMLGMVARGTIETD